MKTYKDFEKKYIGESDIASILMAGPSNGDLLAKYISFGEDGAYDAYIVDDVSTAIGEHYQKVAQFENWMKIYDDKSFVTELRFGHIEVYRAALRGCIIRCWNDGTKNG